MALPSSHPAFDRLFQAIIGNKEQLLRPWTGNVLRATEPRWISRPYRFTGAGALVSGGRWNIKGLMPAIYFATDLATLHAEADEQAGKLNFSTEELKPQTRIAVALKLSHVLCLTDPGVLKQLGVTLNELYRADWRHDQGMGREAISQAISRAVFENFGEGLSVPSFRKSKGNNIVVFPTHLQPGSSLVVRNEEELPFMHGLI